MKNEAEIKEKIKELRKKIRNSFPCDDCHVRAKIKISALMWVLKEGINQ